MVVFKSLCLATLIAIGVNAHLNDRLTEEDIGQIPISGPYEKPMLFDRPVLERDGYVPSFSGISTYAHLPYLKCWDEQVDEDYDIAIVGAPYDIGVTFRTGARFGPSGIREGSKRIKIESYTSYILSRPTRPSLSKINQGIPRLITLGGDHTILLPVLRAMHKKHKRPITVIHFDSHLDTWAPEIYNVKARGSKYNHGNPLYHAAKEGLTTNGTSLHVGIRSTLYDQQDFARDEALGFRMIKSNDVFSLGVEGISNKIQQILGSKQDALVYLSIDIDVIDPSMAPATGTPESGGFLTREIKYILRSLEGYNIIGMDMVEVAPAYDTQAQLTTFLAADLIYEVLSMIVKYGETH